MSWAWSWVWLELGQVRAGSCWVWFWSGLAGSGSVGLLRIPAQLLGWFLPPRHCRCSLPAETWTSTVIDAVEHWTRTQQQQMGLEEL